MLRRHPRSTLFPTRRSSDLRRGPSLHVASPPGFGPNLPAFADRKSTRLNSSHSQISYAVFCLKKKTTRIVVTPLLSELHWIGPDHEGVSQLGATHAPCYSDL